MKRTASVLIILIASTAFTMAADPPKNGKEEVQPPRDNAKAKKAEPSETAEPRMKIPAADKPHDQKK